MTMTVTTKLIVLPRHRAKKYSPDVPHAIISITDPYPHGEMVKFPKRWGQRGICSCDFYDFDPLKNKDQTIGPVKYPDLEYKGKTLREWSMRADNAAIIVEFVLLMLETVELFIVHCEAGASRSPSIAMAIADSMEWGRDCIDWIDPHGEPPNQHVYHEMMCAFERL